MFTTFIVLAIWEFFAFGFYRVMLEKVEEEIESRSTKEEKAKTGMALGALCAVIALFPFTVLF